LAQSSAAASAKYHLETFGGLALAGGGPRSLSHQRLRLALLALLAASGERGLSRDQIVGYLWPEGESASARHSLEQLLHSLRRALGDSVFSGKNPIALNHEVVRSDVADFDAAFAREDYATAVGLYRGTFLTGFYLDNAGEFERWVESERARLAGRYADALLRLADGAEQAGDVHAAVEWRKRIAASDPLRSRYALQYMRALAASGDSGAALSHARVHEQLVRQELETDPDPTIVAYASALRDGVVEIANTAPRESVRVVDDGSIQGTDGAAQLDALPLHGTNGSPAAWTRRARIAAIGAAAAVLALALWAGVRSMSLPRRDSHAVAIVPFRIVSADSAWNVYAEGIADLLSIPLTGEGGLRAVNSRTAISGWKRIAAGREGTADDARRVAREVGAGQALFGTLVVTPSSLTLSANVLDADGGERQSPVSVTALVDSIQPLVDAFVRQLLGRRSGMPEPTLATLTTVSIPALRAYLEGRAAFRHQGHDADAIRDFEYALEIDSTFALAGLDLAVATLKFLRQSVCSATTPCRFGSVISGLIPSTEEDARFDTGLRLAWQSRAKLGMHDRQLLDALRGRHFPEPSSAHETLLDLQAAARDALDRAETQYLMGIVMLVQGAALDYPDALERANALFANALALDSTFLAPIARLVDVAGYERDPAKVRLYGRLYLARDSVGPMADFVRWRVAVGTDDAAGLRAIRARFESLDPVTLRQIVYASQIGAVALDDAERGSALVLARSTDPQAKARALYDAHMLALNRGRPRLADSLLRERYKINGDSNYWQTATLAALFGNGSREVMPEIARARLARLAASPVTAAPRSSVDPGASFALRTLLAQAMWDYDRKDTAAVAAAVRRLHDVDAAWLADVVDMLFATDQRRPDAAILRARVDSIARQGCCGGVHSHPVYINFALALAFEHAGDDASALRAIRRVGDEYFLAANLKHEGNVAYRLKDNSGARRAFEKYLVLRSDPEPSLRAERDSVQALVNRLKTNR